MLRIFFTAMLFFALILAGKAQNTLYSLSEMELRAVNAVTLMDALRMLPLVNVINLNDQERVQFNGEPLHIAAVYKDSLPLFMDNIAYPEYASILLYDVVKLELVIANENSGNKGIRSANIYLYSKNMDEVSSLQMIEGMVSGALDGRFFGLGYISNFRHSYGLSFQRSFMNAKQTESDLRSHRLPAYWTDQVGLRYKLRIAGNSSVSLAYENQVYSMLKRRSIIPGTSRTTNLMAEDDNQRLLTNLDLNLSKAHSLKMGVTWNGRTYSKYVNEIDLSSDKIRSLEVASIMDSIRYSYWHGNALLMKRDSARLWYGIGMEFTSFQDRNLPFIEGVKIAYTDYVVLGKIRYDLNSLTIHGGLNFLVNTYMGNSFLPRLQVYYKPSEIFYVNAGFNRTVLYPKVHQLYYPIELSQLSVQNNLGLNAAVGDLYALRFGLNSEKVMVESGVLWSQTSSLAVWVQSSNMFENAGISETLVNYISVKGNTQNLKWQLLGSMIGVNSEKMEYNQFTYAPQANFKLNYLGRSEKWGAIAIGDLQGSFSSLYRNEAGVLEDKFEPYYLIDVLTYVQLQDDKLLMSLGCTDILNSCSSSMVSNLLLPAQSGTVAEAESYHSYGRKLVVSLRYSLK